MQRTCRRVLGFAVYYASFFYYLVLLPLCDPKEDDARFRTRLREAIRFALKGFGVQVVIEGEQHLRHDTNVIIVANHSSWFDQLALLASLDLPITFMAKQQYFTIPGLALVLRKLECVPISSSTVGESLNASRKLLSRGKSLVVYPEGTRSASLLPFRRGAALLAEQTGIPAQPIVIHGSQQVLPRLHSFLDVRPGVIKLQIHPPMYKPKTVSVKEFMAQIERIFVPSQPVAERMVDGSLADDPGAISAASRMMNGVTYVS